MVSAPPSAAGQSCAPPDIRLHLLGGFRVAVDGRTVEHRAWRLHKAKTLLKLLALAPGRRLHREVVQDALWPDLEAEAASNNLNQTLHAARRALQPDLQRGAGSAFLHLLDDTLSLAGPAWTDVDAFDRGAAAATRCGDIGALEAAAAAYGGDLLPEDRYAAWAEAPREQLRQTYLSLLLSLARRYEAYGSLDAAGATLQRMVAAEAAHEAAHVALMCLHARRGDRGAALRQYRLLQEALRRDLDAAPAPESQRAYDEILAGRFPHHTLVTPARPDGPAVTAAAAGHNLPARLTTFVGRQREIEQIAARLATARLVTLTGAGGSGKTSLGLAAGARLLPQHPDGVWLVELAPLGDAALVAQQVAAALGLRGSPERPTASTASTASTVDALATFLGPRRLLLLLDNCEYLVGACAALAAALLQACPHLRILATSREALHVPGEVLLPVPVLSCPSAPDGGTDVPLSAEAALRYDAVRLFAERAALSQQGFVVTAENAATVAHVCRRLDGLPLAIELAAARLRVLSLEQLAARLDDRFRLLTGGARTAPARHQTLAAAVSWSYDALTAPERLVLNRLSVFAGGCTLAAAEAVCAGGDVAPSDVLDVLVRLVDKSLVVAGTRLMPDRRRAAPHRT